MLLGTCVSLRLRKQSFENAAEQIFEICVDHVKELVEVMFKYL